VAVSNRFFNADFKRISVQVSALVCYYIKICRHFQLNKIFSYVLTTSVPSADHDCTLPPALPCCQAQPEAPWVAA
jgi:hypothetical protein